MYRYQAATAAFTHFTSRDGLCDNTVSAIVEDKAGQLWFGTAKGVCRYDGHAFTDMSQQAGLCANASGCAVDVNCILEDKAGTFWFGTNGWGLYRYQPAGNAVTHFTPKDGLGSAAVQCLLEDAAGTLWVGERAGGVCQYQAATGRFAAVNGKGCFSSQMMGIIEAKTGHLWFANLYEGLCRYAPKTGGFAHFTPANGLCFSTVTCLYEDTTGALWFGSDRGSAGTSGGSLCRYDGQSFTSFGAQDGLSNFAVWAIVEDQAGNLWVGTRGHLYRYHAPSHRFIDYTYKLPR